MPFRGTLKQGSAFTIDVTNNANNTDKCAYTVFKINKTDRVSDANPVTVDLNATGSVTDTPSGSINRVMIILNPPPAGPNGAPIVNVRVSQNNAIVANDTYGTDVEIVFDCTP